MFVLVVGGGKLGANLARMVQDEGHEVAVVEQDRTRCQTISEWLSGKVIEGDGCEPSVLESAGIARADVVAVVTGDDEDNLVGCLLARHEYGVGSTIARINDPRNEWLFDTRFGVDVAVSTTRIMAQLLTEEVKLGRIVTHLGLLRQGVAVAELTIPEGAPSLGRPLSELGVPSEAMLVLVMRDGDMIVPGPALRLQAGDEVLAVAHAESEEAMRDVLLGPGTGSA